MGSILDNLMLLDVFALDKVITALLQSEKIGQSEVAGSRLKKIHVNYPQ